MSAIEIFKYLPESIRKKDTDGELRLVTKAIDVALNEVAREVLSPAWNVEQAPREELITMINSLGLHYHPYMTDEILRKYIRSSGKIRELKGTDDVINHLVDKLTHFNVVDISLDENNHRIIHVKVMRGNRSDFDKEQVILDFLIERYSRMIATYQVTYIVFSEVEWLSPLEVSSTSIVRSVTELKNFVIVDRNSDVFLTPFNLMPFVSNAPSIPDIIEIKTESTRTRETINVSLSTSNGFSGFYSLDFYMPFTLSVLQ
jgi:hypothetical protein